MKRAVLFLLPIFLTTCDNWNLSIKDKLDFYQAMTPVGTWDELKQAVDSGAGLIALTRDIELCDTDTTIIVARSVTITAVKGRHTISRGLDDATAFKAALFQVDTATGNLTLGHPQGGTLVLDGGAVWNAAHTTNSGVTASISLVRVENGSLTLDRGAELRNNHRSSGSGGAVLVFADSGGTATFTMKGGTISGNTAGEGGGVYVHAYNGGADATFTLKGGTIRGNTANSYYGGGVFVHSNGGTAGFIMEGGTISDNTAGRDGGGVFVNDFSGTATFTLKGGTISDNTAGWGGGGVSVTGTDATFTMEGGTIGGNTAGWDGGGVSVNDFNGIATFTKSGGGIIYGDTDTYHTPGSDENTSTIGDGHAVYYYALPTAKKRDATLAAGDDISTTNTSSPPWD
jgi:hypothetical protein